MDFSTKTLDAKNALTGVKTGALVVGIYENRKLSKAAGRSTSWVPSAPR
jgi:leucyl aminopeptidase